MLAENAAGSPDAPRLVLATFVGPFNARQALDDLHAAAFTADDVSVVARNEDTRREIVEQTGLGESQDAPADTMMGALKGSAVGGALGLGALFIPGVGPLLAAGVLATTIGGAAVGAAVGGQDGVERERGITGADLATTLAARGVPPDEARAYEARVRDNQILIAALATTDEAAQLAHSILEQHGGEAARLYGGPPLRREEV